MVRASADGAVTVWTEEAERLLRYSPDDVTGRAFPSLALDATTLERALSRVRRSESVHTICLTTRLTTKDGREAPAFVCVDALRDPEGRVAEFQITFRDLRTVVFEPGLQDARGYRPVPDPGAVESLTPRQRLVLELIARGHTTREIAKGLNRSVKTIETHRAQLMRRLNIFHVPGLVRLAIRAGLVTLE
jgi:PAS domain S-box-containing protein